MTHHRESRWQRLQRVAPAALAATAGAAIAALFDPITGKRRRAMLRDKFRARGRSLARDVATEVEYERGRAVGIVHRMLRRPPEPEQDTVLADKVSSEVLGKPEFAAQDVILEAFDGVVILRGQIANRDLEAALREAVAAVPGVGRVVSYLHLPGEMPPNKAASIVAS